MKPQTILAGFALTTTTRSVMAHDGHGNTPLHAVMHMIEQNGLPILLVFIVTMALLVIRSRRQKSGSRVLRQKGDGHDSR